MLEKPDFDLSLPYITEQLNGIGGKIKVNPEDFIVDEVQIYEPSGQGKHLYVNITKKNKTTREVQIALAKLFDLNPDQIGRAGLKDKKAITSQNFSIFFENNRINHDKTYQFIENNLDVKVNWVKLHNHKLRTGNLLGKSFNIKITEIEIPVERAFKHAQKIADLIHKVGIPNYYGEQRIGENGKNVAAGWEILVGKKRIRDRWLKKYLISSYQSYLCNRYLACRIKTNHYYHLMKGDIAKKHDTGGMFTVKDAEKEKSRYLSKEISFTAPIFGYKMLLPKDSALELENTIIEETGFKFETWKKNKIKGTRRLGRLVPKIDIKKGDDFILLKFFLPKGGFASVLLREFIKNI
jgi:tRNA pseudouridine13 synthase